jgi:hypothetical protein
MSTSAERDGISLFLKSHDLDVLHDLHGKLGRVSAQDMELIIRVITEWKNEQAISNLLFYPELIPIKYRYHAIMKAMQEDAAPYYTLAAVVGLQSIKPAEFNMEQRNAIVGRLLELIGDEADVISSRASVTIWDYLDDSNFTDFLRIYPVADNTANKNILAYTMSRYAETPRKVFRKNLRQFSLPWKIRRRFLKHFKKFKKSQRDGSDVFLRAPVYEEVPNLRDVDQRVDTMMTEVA